MLTLRQAKSVIVATLLHVPVELVAVLAALGAP